MTEKVDVIQTEDNRVKVAAVFTDVAWAAHEKIVVVS
jgi:hypothetical protein